MSAAKQMKQQQNSATHKGVPWLGTHFEQHNRGQQRVLEERIGYVRSMHKGLERGIVGKIDPKDFKQELLEVAI